MKITAAQLNFHVGNFDRNVKMICDTIRSARAKGSDLVVFSELSVPGYPPHDLLEQQEFIKKCYQSLEVIASECKGISALVGSPSLNDAPAGKRLFNSAFFLHEGRIADVFHKSLLPTYDIFDEYRYFEPLKEYRILKYRNKRIAVTICEDLWDEQGFENDFTSSRLYTVSPMDELAKLEPDIIINLSASPFSARRIEEKRRIFTEKAARHRLPLFMVNQVGGNTELIFEGGSMVVDPSGKIYDYIESFGEQVRTYDLDEVIKGASEELFLEKDHIPLIHDALILGIKDYFGKMKFKSAVLGLSGGIDSAVTLCLAVEALGSNNMRVLLLPSMYSSDHSVTDAVKLAENLGVEYDLINISDSFNSVKESLYPIMKDYPEDVTEENIQARLRSILLMAVSNKFGNILLNTSNKSEAAVGYSTLYGDMSGGLSVLGDVYKSDVYKLAGYINKENEIIPNNTITKLPSAELRPAQQDTDTLPEYQILDEILYQYIELQRSPGEITGEGITGDTIEKVISMINLNEYKRFQAPPILRISSKAFGYGRRMPLVAKY
ncbi:MAG TPA: NAD+ synthase [Bacteroidales bacterium]|nr:NAD+ synthase [Bacteroidales bacterium]